MFIEIGSVVPNYPALDAKACDGSMKAPILGVGNKMVVRSDKTFSKIVKLRTLINKLNPFNFLNSTSD